MVSVLKKKFNSMSTVSKALVISAALLAVISAGAVGIRAFSSGSNGGSSGTPLEPGTAVSAKESIASEPTPGKPATPSQPTMDMPASPENTPHPKAPSQKTPEHQPEKPVETPAEEVPVTEEEVETVEDKEDMAAAIKSFDDHIEAASGKIEQFETVATKAAKDQEAARKEATKSGAKAESVKAAQRLASEKGDEVLDYKHLIEIAKLEIALAQEAKGSGNVLLAPVSNDLLEEREQRYEEDKVWVKFAHEALEQADQAYAIKRRWVKS